MYFTKGGITCLGQRFFSWVKTSALTNNSSKHVSEVASVRIVCKTQTLLEATFTVGRDQMR